MQQEKQEDEFDKITNALDFSTVEIDESSEEILISDEE